MRKKIPCGVDENLPDIVEAAVLRRNLLDQRDVLQRAVGVGFQETEVG